MSAVSRAITLVVIAYADERETRSIFEWITELVESSAHRDSLAAIVWDNRAHQLDLPAAGARVQYVSSPNGNVGFGRAVNAALDGIDSDRALLLNFDIELGPAAFDLLVSRLLKLPTDVIWAPTLLNSDGTLQTTPGSLFMRTMWQEVRSIWGFPARGPVFRHAERRYLRGAVFSISIESFRAVGGFDPVFFLYGEEADLCFRSSARLELDPEIRIVHSGSQGNDGKSEFAFKQSLRARVLLQRRYNGRLAAVVTWVSARLYVLALRLVGRHP